MVRCNANLVSTGHMLYFQPKHPARAIFAAINNRLDVARLRCNVDSFKVFLIINSII